MLVTAGPTSRETWSPETRSDTRVAYAHFGKVIGRHRIALYVGLLYLFEFPSHLTMRSRLNGIWHEDIMDVVRCRPIGDPL